MKHEKLLVTASLVVMCVVSFFLRIIPYFVLFGDKVVNSPDTYGHIARIDWQLHTNEIMGQFPFWQYFEEISDTYSHDGYLFSYLCTGICKLFGVDSIEGIIHVAGFIPVVIGICFVPLFYFVGKYFFNSWKVGLLTAGMSVVTGYHLYLRTIYSCIDHHCLEILFVILLLFFFVLAIDKCRKTKNIRQFFLFSVLSGICYGLSVLTIRSCLLFGLIICVYAVIQMIVDFKNGKQRYTDIPVASTVYFLMASVLLLIHGITDWSFTVEIHSFGIVAVQLCGIIGVWVIWTLSYLLQKKTKKTRYFLLSILGLGAVGLGVASLIPSLWDDLINALTNKLLFVPVFEGTPASAMADIAPMSLGDYLMEIHLYFPFLLIGFGVFLYKLVKNQDARYVFGIVCIAILGYITAIHNRWLIYCEPFMILLIILGFLSILNYIKNAKNLTESNKKITKGLVVGVLCIGVLVCGIGYAGSSFNYVYDSEHIADEEGLYSWFKENAEPNGLEYYHKYTESDYHPPDYVTVSFGYGFRNSMYSHQVMTHTALWKADNHDVTNSGLTTTANIYYCEDDSVYELLNNIHGRYIIFHDSIYDDFDVYVLWSDFKNVDKENTLAYKMMYDVPIDKIEKVYENNTFKIFKYTKEA